MKRITNKEMNPRDQQWLQEMCEMVEAKCPDSHAFVVFAFPMSMAGRCFYTSNADVRARKAVDV